MRLGGGSCFRVVFARRRPAKTYSDNATSRFPPWRFLCTPYQSRCQALVDGGIRVQSDALQKVTARQLESGCYVMQGAWKRVQSLRGFPIAAMLRDKFRNPCRWRRVLAHAGVPGSIAHLAQAIAREIAMPSGTPRSRLRNARLCAITMRCSGMLTRALRTSSTAIFS